MKKILSLVLMVVLVLAPTLGLSTGVELTMGSWRMDDAAKVQALLDVYKAQTGVSIVFQPTSSPQYNTVLRTQLDAGIGPDLMYARSYATGEDLYTNGFFMDVTDVPGVVENFVIGSLDPWMAADGAIFAVPFAAVSQPIYYNKDLFAQAGCEVPATWDELIDACDKLVAAGITPFANGIASNWDILECVFLGMLPNYIGGPEGREAYEEGIKSFTDYEFLKAFSDFQDIAAVYFPEGFTAIENNDSGVLFGLGGAAMLMDGSWSCGTVDEYGLNWGSFAFPVPSSDVEGFVGYAGMCFHPDMGIAGNPATKYPEEVKAFLAWIATPEGAQITADYLPQGFFPMIDAPITFTNARVTEILALNQGRVTDTRFVWPQLLDLYTPFVDNLNALARNEITPMDAAEAVQAAFEGLGK